MGVRPLAISRDSVWSHVAWAQSLRVEVPLLSDWDGEAARAFGVVFEPLGMQDVPMRSSFLIEDAERIVESWLHGREQPDLDAVIAAAQAAQADVPG